MHLPLARFLIVLALAMALPIQAFAAVAAALCMPAAAHGLATAGTQEGEAGQQGEIGQQGGAGQEAQHYCPPCVACCAAAAIAYGAPASAVDDRADEGLAVAAVSLSGIEPDPLDKPPLSL